MTHETIRSTRPMTVERAADMLNCSARTVRRLVVDGYLTQYGQLQASRHERYPILLWEWEVLELRAARIRAGKQMDVDEANPCSGGRCTDPEAHAEGAHDV